ncbi:MAG: histidine phosphatase family protein [Bilifractor sp.]
MKKGLRVIAFILIAALYLMVLAFFVRDQRGGSSAESVSAGGESVRSESSSSGTSSGDESAVSGSGESLSGLSSSSAAESVSYGSEGTELSGNGESSSNVLSSGGEMVSADSSFQSAANGEVTIFIVRHGKTEANENEILQGSGSDSALTQQGKAQVRSLGEALSSVKFDRAWSSEAGRAKTTAEILLEENKAGSVRTVETLPELDDIDWGDAEDRKLSDVEEKYGTFNLEKYIGSPDDSKAESVTGGESAFEFCDRFGDGIRRILSESSDSEKVLAVVHSSAALFLQELFPDQNISGIDNASLTILRYRDGNWELLDLNDTNYGGIPGKLSARSLS